MKSKLFAFAAGLILSGAFSFTLTRYEQSKPNAAEVEQIEGLYVFTDSKPMAAFDYIGTEKVGVVMSGDYNTIRDKLIKKIKKDRPTANGLILHMDKGNEKADAILLK